MSGPIDRAIDYLLKRAIEEDRARIIATLEARMDALRDQWLDGQADGYLEAIDLIKGQK